MSDSIDRPEWRPRKPRGHEVANAAARAREAEPIPSAEALRDEMLRTMRSIATDETASAVARVAAAKAILDETAPDVRAHLLRLLKGDRAKLRAWLLAELAELDKAEAK